MTTPSRLRPHDEIFLPSTGELFGHLRAGRGVDLEAYRPEALRPQLLRRVQALGLASIQDYVEHMTRDARELDQLLDALLIGSTAFFRDPLSFAAVGAYFTRHAPAHPEHVRAWVAGCSTGEEAYSIAISLFEALAKRGEKRAVRVFATDLRLSSVQRARAGLYSPASLSALSPERLAAYFEPALGGYRVKRHLRDAVVFGQHDLLRDPPFSKLDLISCRNVLLYLREPWQRRLLTKLHFGLVPAGMLFLGPAESAAHAPGLFHVHDREHRLYLKAVGSRRASEGA